MSAESPEESTHPRVNTNSIRSIKLEKVVVNIGVGTGGDRLEKAKSVLTNVTGAKPCERRAVDTIREFNVRKSEPIAAVVTLRGKPAEEFLVIAFKSVGNKIRASAFSGRTFSFGIKEHITIPGVKYDPKIGVLGMDVCVALERPGFRVSKRRRMKSKVGKAHRISTEDSVNFIRGAFGVDVI